MSNDSSIPGKGRIVNKGNGNLQKLQVAWSYRSTKQEVEKYGAGEVDRQVRAEGGVLRLAIQGVVETEL